MRTRPSHPVTVLLASARTPVPWRNGAGTTTVVAASSTSDSSFSSDEVCWRVSIATIERDAPFSFFAGVDRALMPLSAEGLRLSMDGVVTTVARHEVATFAGEERVEAVDVTGSGLDLNLMTRRDRATGQLEIFDIPGMVVVDVDEMVIAVVVDGEVCLGSDNLGGLDAAEIIGPISIAATGRGKLGLAHIFNVNDSLSKRTTVAAFH